MTRTALYRFLRTQIDNIRAGKYNNPALNES